MLSLIGLLKRTMVLLGLVLISCISPTLAASSSSSSIERDVLIIGGGSGGTYAAIRLQQMGVKVALIEKKNRLGGHVNTYVDPSTNQTYDYGVQVFSNISVVTNYFEHLGIPLEPLTSSGGGVSENVNFHTGEPVASSSLLGGNLTAALMEYDKQISKFPEIFNGWDLPCPIPEELLMPFGDFLEKHKLSPMAYTAFIYGQGAANILAQPTLYVMKYQDPLFVHNLLYGGSVRNALNDNQKLYDNALADLGSNAFLQADITRVTRHPSHVQVVFSTPQGQKIVKASKLLIAIPPTLANLNFLDLDKSDQTLLGHFNNSYYWDMMIKDSGIPDNTSVSNVDPAAPFNLPSMPGLYGFGATPIENVHSAYYSSPHLITNDEVKANALATLARIRKSLGYAAPDTSPKFVGFHDHSPFELTVSNEAIRDGFYENFTALQGKDRTYWTGAAWINPASSTIWNYTEHHVLPHLVVS